MSIKTHQLQLKQRPNASVPHFSPELFELVSVELPALREGEFLVESKVFSCDPTQRIWVTDQPQYMPPVMVGEPMRSGFGGVVVQSKSAKFPVGANVAGFGHWAEHVVQHESGMVGVIPAGVPVELGVAAGLCPETAYVGLFCTGPKPLRPGETVLITGAAGATGSAAVQMAKIIGATVIASAGGAEKCAYLKTLGADHVIDYKSEDFAKRLAEIAPGKIDFMFDNVGGEQLDATLLQLNMNARIIICGAISEYENPSTRYGLKNYPMLLMRRATMTGFIFMDSPVNVANARAAIGKWLQTGQLKIKLDVTQGTLKDVPKTVSKLFKGENHGKTLHSINAKL
jgi:NADPH-dependent curcumin reductase